MVDLSIQFQNVSFECLEQALVDCPCELFLVSHDRRFLDALAHKQWHISYVSHLKNLIVGFYTHIANNTSNLLILLQIKKI